eukprot:TRINITY_DN8556_c0_g1_i1.p1 TRINITY_DN8556_c0_g1~~TRINITY_DN8556_c0_g1_i1.p1  ORF type:complete len:128 (+),score=44.08 TRINITY_DN8556_c0_g1_i1:198-581(+)
MFACFGGGETSIPDDEGFYYACKFTDVAENKPHCVKINKKSLMIVRTKDDRGKTRVYCLGNTCQHQGTPLHRGDIEDLVDGTGKGIKCSGHQYVFRLDNGQCVTAGKQYQQRVYEVKKKNGDEIWIK